MSAYGLMLSKVLGREQCAQIVEAWKRNGEKVVFTNGCFDILHLGHVSYLAKARDLGNRLVVGLNTDSSVRKLKGPLRPAQDEKARASILASLFFVDAVVFFDEDTPEELISTLVPSVLVKGADYKPEDIAGADTVLSAGGQVLTIDLVSGYSTTNLIEKIAQ
jgi:D-glycero-beta-D-manno-heptose 1-phosphate adenylyltransferase